MRKIFTSIFLFISAAAFSQALQVPPNILWQHCFGGSLDDIAYGITSTGDGYLVVGCAGSSDGDILKPDGEQHGGTCDYWALKMDLNGTEQYKLHIGGTSSDQAFSAQVTPDGNYVIGGTTASSDLDVIGNHSANQLDYWIVKVTPSLSVIWKKCYGSTGYDDFGSIINTSDGNLAFCGGAQSNDGDVSGNHGDMDFWLVKTDQSGNILWQKCFGGTQYEKASDLKQTADGGYILVGFTESNDGDVSGNHSGDYDGWVVKTDASGNLQWQKCLGGTSQDGFQKVIQLSDQNYLITGYTSSQNGDLTSNYGSDDAWIVMLDPDGNLLWSKNYGGDTLEDLLDVQEDQLGNIETAGYTASNDGDIGYNHGSKDYWLLQVDKQGTILWDTTYGGSYADVCYSMTKANDGGIVLAGYSISNDGDVSGNHDPFHVYKDYWVVKLESVVGIHEIVSTQLNVIPTLAHDVIQISLDDFGNENPLIAIRNATGVNVWQQQANHQSKMTVDISSLPQGIYFIEIEDEQRSAVGKFVKW